ncbi:carbohydrate ABC transporter permease [Phytoactinopolyspora mesophila]|uniref:ABC transporter permease subunit n=1 Tax=Phytoactinopolyspora mesophila TaxID=2650750 RepID=A0A7K3M2D1_9ACTN|nr:sugar ABC transporter permease [Phytoactinopolyspora mesophila]NDL57446.1 ABC transporter permease subunit [Phytoactinopolyspora mesophila]
MTTGVERWRGGATAPTRRRRRSEMARREDRAGRLLVTPTFLVVVAVVLVPFGATLLFAFQDLRVIDIPTMSLTDLRLTWDNFSEVTSSSGFWTAMRTTLIYAALTTIGSIGTGLVVALALRKPFRGRAIVRGLVLVPFVLPVVAAVMIWKTLLNTQYGFVNAFGQEFLGWEAPISFLATVSHEIGGVSVPMTLLVVVVFEIWKSFPLAYLFIMARLQAAQADIEEAALIDGASPLQSFRHVIAPQLYGVIALLSVLRFIWSFQNFNDIYLLTGGAGGTQVIAVRVYEEMATRANIGTASALGLVMTVVLLGFLVVYVRMSRAEVDR